MSTRIRNASTLAPAGFIGGVLALLLVCGATLIGGIQQSKTTATGFSHGSSQAPLVNALTYPKDTQRSKELRSRFSSDGDDQPDPPFALDTHCHSHLPFNGQSPVLCPQSTPLGAFSHYRPQTPRGPPAA